MSTVILSSIRLGTLERHVEYMRGVYERRHNAVIETLASLLPEACTFMTPPGGFFVWVYVPLRQGLTTTLIMDHLMGKVVIEGVPKANVSFAPGNLFSSDGSHGNYLRLAFSMYSEDELMEGCRRLCLVLDRCV
jgi:2-aminoadipate transaminase